MLFLGKGLAVNTLNVEDLRAPVSNIRLAGINPPSSQLYKGGEVLSFPTNQDATLHVTFQIPHSWKTDSPIIIHIHWAIPTDGAGAGAENVKWDLTYSWADTDELIPASTPLTVTKDVQAVSKDTHLYTAWAQITGTGHTISSILLCSVTRDVDVANDYTGAVYLLEVDVHVQMDKLGSDSFF